MASIFHGLHKAAPRLSREFFKGHKCTIPFQPAQPWGRIPGKSALFSNVRFRSTVIANSEITPREAPSLSSLSRTLSKEAEKTVGKVGQKHWKNGKFFPETSSKSVAYWLLGSAASVFGIVVFGGLTRLTESGYAWTFSKQYIVNNLADLASLNGSQ
jgi:cytochrome c oxidase assembly protein subunit 15